MAGSITQALDTARSGLLTAQKALDVTASNISNVNTPGYSRRVPELQTRVLNGTGAGVEMADIKRKVDENLVEDVREETSRLSELSIKDKTYERLQEMFGSPGENSSIAHSLSSLQGAMESLAASPSGALEQNEAVRWGQNVAKELQSLSKDIQDLRQEADAEVQNAVEAINEKTETIEELNNKIVQNAASGESVADLKDQRDQALKELSEYVNIDTFQRSAGDVAVFTASGATLVDNTARSLEYTAAGKVGARVAKGEGDFSAIRVAPESGGTGEDITNDIVGGQLKGAIDLRDGVLPDLQSQLNTLASSLKDAINKAHNRGAPHPGMQSMNGTRQFWDTSKEQIQFQNGTDTKMVIMDKNGTAKESVSLVDDVLGGAGAQKHTIQEVANQLDGWLSSNGYGNASVSEDGGLKINLSDTSSYIAFRGESGTGQGSSPQDATIGFDKNGNGSMDETVSGFSNFFGLNDFYTTQQSPDALETDTLEKGWQTQGSTLTFHQEDAGSGPASAQVILPDNSSLQDIAQRINQEAQNTARLNVTAGVVQDGGGERLRITQENGKNLAVTESGGGNIIGNTGLATSEAHTATQIQVREDLASSPSKVSTGRVAWDSLNSRYELAKGDATVAEDMAQAMSENRDFKQAGGLDETDVDFAEFGSAIVSRNASLAKSNSNDLDRQQQLTNSLEKKSDNISGVNLDEEMSNLILFEQAYSASARVVSTIQNMFDTLNRAVA